MAIAVQMDYTVDLCKPAHLIQMDVPFFTGDKNAHRFHVKLMRNGCPISVNGITATGYMVRADKQTVVWNGESDGCDIYLTMPASCYAVAGRFRLLLRVTFDDTIETALWVEGSVRESTTETIVDPGTTLPTIEELLDQIAKMETATADAKDATADARLATQELSATVAPPIVVSATGEVITISDSANRPLAGLRLYGKTVQNGVPTPSSPVPMVNVGAGGSIEVSIENGGSVTASTPNGLPGIPVTSGGNYTDANGQMWLCDEIDFGRGVYVQRVDQRTMDGAENWTVSTGGTGRYVTYALSGKVKPVTSSAQIAPLACTAYQTVSADVLYATSGAYYIAQNNEEIWVSKTGFDSVDAFKAYLAANPMTVLYALKTPIETALSADVIAAYRAMTTYKPTTTVYNDAGAGLGVDYVADTKTYIDQRIAAMLKV